MRDISVFYLDNSVPKGSIVVECGNALLKKGYRIKIFNTINFKKSMHYCIRRSPTATNAELNGHCAVPERPPQNTVFVKQTYT